MEQELIDFFEGRGKFTARAEHAGMYASHIPDLFLEYFGSLDQKEKEEMARVITTGALGESKTLSSYVRPAIRLMGDLCMRRYGSYFQGSRDMLENTFNDPANVKQWLRAKDPAMDVQGLAFIREWRYALMLWGVLYMLESEKITQVYRMLLETSRSEHFRESLPLARSVYDQLPCDY